MNLTGLKRGDVIAVDIRGRRFMAFVRDPDERPIGIDPIDSRISHRSCNARQVIGVWRRLTHSEIPRTDYA